MCDNIDKNVRRSFQRVMYFTQSLHYFHSYAVLDRIDLSGVSNELPISKPIMFGDLLPSNLNITDFKQILVILVSR